MRSFGSDNHAPVHPDVLAAIAAANVGSAVAYGADPWTAELDRLIKVHFGQDAEVFPVFNGTGANVVALDAMLDRRYQSVLCSDAAHIHTDEGGAGERYLGCKLVTVPSVDGRLTVGAVDAAAWGWGDEHHTQPKVLSITQSTELGTRYPLETVRELADWAHGKGMLLHVDGARLANAAAGLGVGLGDVTTGCGVDVVSFGGTKNGALAAEAVVFLRPELAVDAKFRRKQAMQLASKLRFTSAQLIALLTDDLWRRNAEHTNALARRLAEGVADLPGVAVTHPVEANAVFATVPRAVVAPLQESYPFYVWDETTTEVRWMVSFDTTAADVDAFVGELRRLLGVADLAVR